MAVEVREHKNPVDFPYEEFFTRMWRYFDAGESNEELNALYDFLKKFGEDSYLAGKAEVLREGVVRTALLEAQSKWLDNADKSTGAEGRTVAKVIAMVFGELADEYRSKPKPQLDPYNPDERDVALHEQLQEDAAVEAYDRALDEEDVLARGDDPLAGLPLEVQELAKQGLASHGFDENGKDITDPSAYNPDGPEMGGMHGDGMH